MTLRTDQVTVKSIWVNGSEADEVHLTGVRDGRATRGGADPDRNGRDLPHPGNVEDLAWHGPGVRVRVREVPHTPGRRRTPGEPHLTSAGVISRPLPGWIEPETVASAALWQLPESGSWGKNTNRSGTAPYPTKTPDISPGKTSSSVAVGGVPEGVSVEDR